MEWTLFAIFLAACFAAGTTGSVFMPGEWYKSLEKPSWTPPNWVFPVTWTVLYFCMAFAAARVAVMEGSAHAMAFWALQIALNTLWTPIFFGLRRIKFAMGVMVALWLAVFGAVLTHWSVDTLAGLVLVPYLVWVTIAAALNFSVMRKNPNVESFDPAA